MAPKMKFQRSSELFGKLFREIEYSPYDDSVRSELSTDLALSAINLAASIHLLCESKQLVAAGILLRSQFEMVVRSVWAYYAASEVQLEKLAANLTEESLEASKNIPLTSDMMNKLDKIEPVENLMISLRELKKSSWLPLNSLVHGGLFALECQRRGADSRPIKSVFLTSNGLALLAFIQIGILTGRQNIQQKIYAVAEKYEDCLPPRR